MDECKPPPAERPVHAFGGRMRTTPAMRGRKCGSIAAQSQGPADIARHVIQRLLDLLVS